MKLNTTEIKNTLEYLHDKYAHLEIEEWSTSSSLEMALGHRLTEIKETGEFLIESAIVNLRHREFVQLTLQPDGTYAPVFDTNNLGMLPCEILEDIASNALIYAEEAPADEQEEDYKWAAGYGTALARMGSPIGADVAAKAYRALGRTLNARFYEAKRGVLGGVDMCEEYDCNVFS